MDAAFLIGQVFNGFSVASIYILAAMGLALSFGLMRVINMAHGEILMVGSYLAYLTILFVPGPLGIVVAMLVALIGAGLFGALLELTLVSKLKARPLPYGAANFTKRPGVPPYCVVSAPMKISSISATGIRASVLSFLNSSAPFVTDNWPLALLLMFSKPIR